MKNLSKHKDKLFVFVLLVTLGNIVYWTFFRIMDLSSRFKISAVGDKVWNVLIILSGFLAIWAILFLVRNYHKHLISRSKDE